MTREQSNAMWRARWQGAQDAGLKMTAYSQREGFRATSAYRWRRRTIGADGLAAAVTKSEKALTVAKRPPAVQFARVTVSAAPVTQACTVLRLTLANGRRAELDLDIVQLGEVLEILERRA